MSLLTREMIAGLLPTGSAWRIQPGSQFDQYLNAQAANWDQPLTLFQSLATVRDPVRTPVLDDAEIEWGVTKNALLTVAQRQAVLTNRKFTKGSSTAQALQTALNLTGFGVGGYGVLAFNNNGGANPQNFVQGSSNITLGGPGQYLGNTAAMLGYNSGGGTLIVNGTIGTTTANYWGLGNFQLGQTVGELGYFQNQSFNQLTYQIPENSGYWPSFIFLAAAATPYPGTITTLTYANVPQSRQNELIELVCRYKPLWIWIVAYINWI